MAPEATCPEGSRRVRGDFPEGYCPGKSSLLPLLNCPSLRTENRELRLRTTKPESNPDNEPGLPPPPQGTRRVGGAALHDSCHRTRIPLLQALGRLLPLRRRHRPPRPL